MARPAALSQADIERATKAAKRAGFDRARIVLDYDKRRIEIIVGEPSSAPQAQEWTDDDV